MRRGIYWQMFSTFLKVGAFTLGGGYAMIPIIEEEVVKKRHWVKEEDFLDLVAVAQTCPGVFAINLSTFVGYKLRHTRGAVCTSLGAALPSFLIILLIAMFFHHFIQWHPVAAMFNGIRPAVVALIAAPTFRLAREAQIGWGTAWIPVGGALLIWAMHVNPIWIIVAAGVGGYVYGRIFKEGRR